MLDVRLTTVSGLARLVATDIFWNTHEAGRVEKFRQKFAAKSAALNASAEAAKAAKAKK